MNKKFIKGQRVKVIGNGNNNRNFNRKFIDESGIVTKFHFDGEIGVRIDGRGIWSFPEDCLVSPSPQEGQDE